jgi:hypothetical protein
MMMPKNIAPALQTLARTESDARRVAAMLDLDPSALAHGSALPVGWRLTADDDRATTAVELTVSIQ